MNILNVVKALNSYWYLGNCNCEVRNEDCEVVGGSHAVAWLTIFSTGKSYPVDEIQDEDGTNIGIWDIPRVKQLLA